MFGRLEQNALREIIAERPKLLARIDALERRVIELGAEIISTNSHLIKANGRELDRERKRGGR
mgnify:CR=1 FL=1